MLNVLEKLFKTQVATPEWQAKIHQIVPSYGTKLNESPAAVQQEWNYTAEVLQLGKPPVLDPSVGTSTTAPGKPAESKPASDMAL
jgi:malate dehydrogenase (quinone)